jgi:chromosome segregation ATPase
MENKELEDFRKKQQLYRSEEDLVDDFQRLMMLNDQDGIQMRVTKLFKH